MQADKPVVLEGYGEIPPVTKWLPNMPAPLNYFGIWAPKGTPEPVVQTMDMIWKKKIANSEPLKKYAAARAALFTPLSGEEAAREAMKMVTLDGLALFRRRQGQGVARHDRHREAAMSVVLASEPCAAC